VFRLCSRIALVEHLLNLLWLIVASLMFTVIIRSHVRGTLRCSLRVALGCAALIALMLFPAVSMTDDLQRAKLYSEAGHSGNLLLLRSLEDSDLSDTLVFASPLLLWMVAALVAFGRMRRTRDIQASAQTRGIRPDAVRPPPGFHFASAA
jgi:cytochrome c oxidase assembly factor CtaG